MKTTMSKILVLVLILALSITCIASCDLLEQATHTHEYTDGVCGCGEKDPNYVPPHTHSFVEGKCECGETDPNYVPPHTHSFVEGKCECGETDPNYVPPHTHSYTEEQTKVPTCTEMGINTFTCECGNSYTELVDANGHDYVDAICSVCNERDPAVPVIVVLALSADKTQAVIGEQITLTAILKTGEGDTTLTDVIFNIIEGDTLGTIEGNVLTISDTAVDGDVIKVQTSYDGIDSNVITVTVIPDTTIDSIHASVNSASQNVMKGSTVSLNATVNPDGIAASFVQWKITAGADIATINGNSLTIADNAETGAVIKVVAYFGEVESNVLEITVAATQEEINQGKYFLTVSNNELTVDKNGATTPVIKVTVLNYNFEKVTDLPVEYVVVAGNPDLISLDAEGQLCYVRALGHGIVTVQVSIPNTNVSETITVTSIVPPTSLAIPEVFAERFIAYSFSYRDNLPFAINIKGENVCEDLIYTFTHDNGATGDDVAVYNADGTITFKKLGKITVSVTSNSGSRIEAKASYTFDINDGYNIYSYAQLDAITREYSYNGQQLNLVVLEKPVDPDGNYTYGYDMVPPAALLPDAEQTFVTSVYGLTVTNIYNPITGATIASDEIDARIICENRNLWVNGNNHCINASQLRIYTLAEAEAYASANGKNPEGLTNISSLFSAEPWLSQGTSGTALRGKTFSVKLYNLEVKGNASVDYDPVNYGGNPYSSTMIGAIHSGINVGHFGYGATYYIDANNLTASGFNTGMNLTGIVGNGKVSNAYAYDCFSTGIQSHANIITFENLKFGKCGATGLELTNNDCKNAGLNGDENQRVTIIGTVDASANLNDGYTTYFNRYVIGQDPTTGAPITVPMVIEGNVANYPEIWVKHLRDSATGEFIFVSLIFEDFARLGQGSYENPTNTSIVDYPNYQEGGIINIMELPMDGSVDTTHQFIELPIYITMPGYGNVFVGTALFYNMNYVAPAIAE